MRSAKCTLDLLTEVFGMGKLTENGHNILLNERVRLILEEIQHESKCAKEISNSTKISISSTYRLLKIMRNHGLIIKPPSKYYFEQRGYQSNVKELTIITKDGKTVKLYPGVIP